MPYITRRFGERVWISEKDQKIRQSIIEWEKASTPEEKKGWKKKTDELMKIDWELYQEQKKLKAEKLKAQSEESFLAPKSAIKVNLI